MRVVAVGLFVVMVRIPAQWAVMAAAEKAEITMVEETMALRILAAGEEEAQHNKVREPHILPLNRAAQAAPASSP